MTHANETQATQTYDAGGNLTRVANVQSDDTGLSSFDYGYDAVGSRTSVEEGNDDRVTWSYDAAYQLTREQRDGDDNYDVTYTYDAGGNRLTKIDSGDTTTYTYDAANQLSTEDDGTTVTTHSYDENGNLTVQDAGGAATTYTRDPENRITLIALPDETVQTMTYDADGMRRKKETADAATVSVWDGQDVLLETSGNGSTQARYTLTPDDLGLLIAQHRDSAGSFYHFDALGSAVGLTDAGETQTDAYRYYAFGELLTSTGNTTNPYRYVGRLGYYNEPSLALQYLRARWYRRRIGQFIRPDPLRWGNSWYVYCRGNPVVVTDPSGLKSDAGMPPFGYGKARYSTALKEPVRDITRPAPQSILNRTVDDAALYAVVNAIQAENISKGWWQAVGSWGRWLLRTGGHRTFDIADIMKKDHRFWDWYKVEARAAGAAAMKLGAGHHRLVSEEMRVTAPADPDWQRALGTSYAYAIADAKLPSRLCVSMQFVVWIWDPFEFNCEDLPYRPKGEIGHLHTAWYVTDYVNEACIAHDILAFSDGTLIIDGKRVNGE